ncbi:MAG: hypothetical protein ACI94Y_004253 [Maribacter sp.]|jgi:hypothetical protein
MEILINHFLFFVAMTFGLDAPVIANHACLEIDLKKKEFRIEYEDLTYIDNDVMKSTVSNFIEKIEVKDVTLDPKAGMTLKSVKFDKDKDEWSLLVNGRFDDLETALEAMDFSIKEDKITYRELSEEKIVKSNGKTAVDGLIWDKDTKKIKLSIDRRQDTDWGKSIEENQGKIKSLSEFK